MNLSGDICIYNSLINNCVGINNKQYEFIDEQNTTANTNYHE
jgi:hypothetical protein